MATGFPCRYKKCNGAVHRGKCPVASARGKKGGSKTGVTKARTGDSNGRFKHGYRECCDTLKTSPHDINCSHARIGMRKKIQVKTNIQIKVEIPRVEWYSQGISVSAVSTMLRGIDGVCQGDCKCQIPAIQASKIHPEDVLQNPARVICHACD